MWVKVRGVEESVRFRVLFIVAFILFFLGVGAIFVIFEMEGFC